MMAQVTWKIHNQQRWWWVGESKAYMRPSATYEGTCSGHNDAIQSWGIRESFCRSLRTSKSNRTTLELQFKRWPCARGRLGRSQGDHSGLKAAEPWRRAYDILQGSQDTEDGLIMNLWRSARSWHTPQAACKAIRLEGLASVGDLAKSKTKKRQEPKSTAVHLALALWLSLIRSQTDGTEPSEGPRSSWRDSL